MDDYDQDEKLGDMYTPNKLLEMIQGTPTQRPVSQVNITLKQCGKVLALAKLLHNY